MDDYPVEEFAWGLGAGAIALLAAVGTAVARRTRTGGRLVPCTGVLMVVGALVAIRPTRTLGPEVVVGLAGVSAAGALAEGRRRVATAQSLAAALLVAVPFAWLLAIDASSTLWVRAVVVVGAAGGAVAAARTDTTWTPSGLPPVLFAVSAAGVFAAVPDTEQAGALLGASVPGALVGWPVGRARLGGAGAAGAVAVLVWVAALGALGRPVAVLGAVACIGLLAALSIGPWLADRWAIRILRPAARPLAPPLLALGVHTLVVAVAARVAGVSDDSRLAVPVAAGAILAACLASAPLRH